MQPRSTALDVRDGPALALILARAGSKGCPGKNSARLNGEPCIAYSIDDARQATRVGRIVVSTDAPDIAADALSAGAEVLQRPPHLATDHARIDDAARDAVQMLDWNTGPVVILYGNVPIRPDGLVDRALELLASSDADSVQSYTRVGKNHPWWMVRIDPASGAVRPWEGDRINNGVYRRQDLPPAYIPDGGVIALTLSALMLAIDGVEPGPHAFLGRESHRRGIETPEGSVIDIDTAIDLVFARAITEQGLHEPASHR